MSVPTSLRFSTLVILEMDGDHVAPGSLRAIGLARELKTEFAVLLCGFEMAPAAVDSVRDLGAVAVWVADSPGLAQPLASRHAKVIAQAANAGGATTVLGTASSFTRDVLPRVAALLDAAMVSDVVGVELRGEGPCFRRLIASGRQCATVKIAGERRVLTARPTAYPPPSRGGELSPVETVSVDSATLPTGMTWESRGSPESLGPSISEARVVVCGGRPLKDKETFDRLIGGLAGALRGATGATRGAVDAGLAPNHSQIGQTAKIVAPELYLAVGVSGAIQHVAGITDAKIIVAINRDPEAPIFQVANYGLVGDLFEIVPRMIQMVRT